MVFPEPWVKHSLGFSRFFFFLYQFIDSKRKTRWNLFNQKTKFVTVKTICMIVITRQENKNICKVNQKTHKYTSGKSEE